MSSKLNHPDLRKPLRPPRAVHPPTEAVSVFPPPRWSPLPPLVMPIAALALILRAASEVTESASKMAFPAYYSKGKYHGAIPDGKNCKPGRFCEGT